MTIRLVPEIERAAWATKVRRIVSRVPRCVALSRAGRQCPYGIDADGKGGGYGYVDGERVPLCGGHIEHDNVEVV